MEPYIQQREEKHGEQVFGHALVCVCVCVCACVVMDVCVCVVMDVCVLKYVCQYSVYIKGHTYICVPCT